MKGNGLIVYYSWVGNTEVVASAIQAQTGFATLRIEEAKERKMGNIMGAAMGAFFGLRSRLKPMDYAMGGYEDIFLGCQVWAGKTAPALNQYLHMADFQDKYVWLFLTKADDKVPLKVIDSITTRIESRGGHVVDCISITTKWDPKSNTPDVPEDTAERIAGWLQTKEPTDR